MFVDTKTSSLSETEQFMSSTYYVQYRQVNGINNREFNLFTPCCTGCDDLGHAHTIVGVSGSAHNLQLSYSFTQ